MLGPYKFLYSGSMFCWQSTVLFRAPKGQSMRNPQMVDEDKVNVLAGAFSICTGQCGPALARVVVGSCVLIFPRAMPHRCRL